MKRKGKAVGLIKILISSVLFISALFCVSERIPKCFSSQNSAVLAAAKFTLADGTYKLVEENQANKDKNKKPKIVTSQTSTSPQESTKSDNKPRNSDNYYNTNADHTGEEKYEIRENSYFGGGTTVENFNIKNKTDENYDFSSILNTPLTFKVEQNSKSPQVLIYHTHTTEGYMDEDVDYFYESFYSRTRNNDFNVVAVGNAITDALNESGVYTIHDTTIHDATYDGAYDRSVQTVAKDMEQNKDIKVVLDIHRDAIGTNESKVKPVFTYNGKKAAQIMILSGCDDGSDWFPNWKNNLNFALKIQSTAEKMYPGMTRPLSFDYFRYNEYVCDGSLLIEVGTDANSIDEAEYTGKLLGNVLAEVLK